jgi:L-lactate permease
VKNGTTLGIVSFFIGVIGLMITGSKLWLYGGFGLLVVLTVVQMIIDSMKRNRDSSEDG